MPLLEFWAKLDTLISKQGSRTSIEGLWMSHVAGEGVNIFVIFKKGVEAGQAAIDLVHGKLFSVRLLMV